MVQVFHKGTDSGAFKCYLGRHGDVQILDGIDTEETKRYMHHYNSLDSALAKLRVQEVREEEKSVTEL